MTLASESLHDFNSEGPNPECKDWMYQCVYIIVRITQPGYCGKKLSGKRQSVHEMFVAIHTLSESHFVAVILLHVHLKYLPFNGNKDKLTSVSKITIRYKEAEPI